PVFREARRAKSCRRCERWLRCWAPRSPPGRAHLLPARRPSPTCRCPSLEATRSHACSQRAARPLQRAAPAPQYRQIRSSPGAAPAPYTGHSVPPPAGAAARPSNPLRVVRRARASAPGGAAFLGVADPFLFRPGVSRGEGNGEVPAVLDVHDELRTAARGDIA